MTACNPAPHHRRSIRLQGYDYASAGAYFVTICTKDRECLFGDITDAIMQINDAGRIVQQCWQNIPLHFPHVQLDEYIIMLNHIHGIICIETAVGAKNFSPLPTLHIRPRGTSKTIGAIAIVRGFKIGVTKWMRQHTAIHDVWQRNYWEHVIRDDAKLNSIREYIYNNPAQWELDELYTETTAA
jgi:putative transposase